MATVLISREVCHYQSRASRARSRQFRWMEATVERRLVANGCLFVG